MRAYSVCTAQSCAECDGFNHCFGEEAGESFLARSRRGYETGKYLVQPEASWRPNSRDRSSELASDKLY